MAQVVLEGLEKAYGAVKVVKGVDLIIEDGSFVSLLGPSGCGKTTTLRMIAGLEAPTGGRLLIGDEVVSEPGRGIFVPPERRRLGMVFQSYAVWPHKNVRENVAYPLRVAKEVDREARVTEALELVQLGGLGERMPNQLSGGQQQRVALARALVMRPRVLLLDEPLSNLDAHLRVELRQQIASIARRLKMTVVYVTHDQEEALALADQIVVLRGGVIEQAGPPREVYASPQSRFVGGFIGRASFVRGRVSGVVGGAVEVALEEGSSVVVEARGERWEVGALVEVMWRPGWLELDGSGALEGEVEEVVYLGDQQEVRFRLGEGSVKALVDAGVVLEVGARVRWRAREARLFRV